MSSCAHALSLYRHSSANPLDWALCLLFYNMDSSSLLSACLPVCLAVVSIHLFIVVLLVKIELGISAAAFVVHVLHDLQFAMIHLVAEPVNLLSACEVTAWQFIPRIFATCAFVCVFEYIYTGPCGERTRIPLIYCLWPTRSDWLYLQRPLCIQMICFIIGIIIFCRVMNFCTSAFESWVCVTVCSSAPHHGPAWCKRRWRLYRGVVMPMCPFKH